MQDVFDASHDPAFSANAVKKCVTESNKKSGNDTASTTLCTVLAFFFSQFYHKKV